MDSAQIAEVIRRRRLRRARRHQGAAQAVRWLAILGLAALLAVAVVLGAGAVATAQVYQAYVSDLPSADTLSQAFESSNNQFFQTTKIYDRTGQHLLYEVIDPRAGDRQWLGIADIPPAVVWGTVAIEDKTFFENPGYDLEGIARALYNNLQGLPVQGGSSITQQLVKNVILSPNEIAEQSYDRKIREVLIAAEVTNRYSKEQILEWYLNTNFYGNLAYGIDAAARVYFAKSATELDLAESAMLAAIPQFPALNPIDNPDLARQRQELVLDAMVREGYITQAEADAAKAVDIFARLQSFERRFEINAPHFVFYVLRELSATLPENLIYRGGLRIYTTLDYDLHHQAECVARTQIVRLSGAAPTTVIAPSTGGDCPAAAFLPALRASDIGVDHNLTNASVVVIRPETGEILAMVGSLDYWDDSIDGRFNVATDGLRQPGSSFKPFSYITAFSQGYTSATMLLDIRAAFATPNGPYVPENYDRQFHGPVSLRVALARSYNLPAVKISELVGIENVLRTAHRMGINTLNDDPSTYGLALSLGGGEVRLIDMTYAYSVMANNGIMAGQPTPLQRSGYRTLDPVSILRIENSTGQTLQICGPGGAQPCEYTRPYTQAVLSTQLAYLITNILSDRQARIGAFGSPNPLELDRPAAAKTGTTNDFVDNWTLGYTPQLATGVWVGNSDSSPMENVTGLTGAAPIWHAVMMYAHRDLPVVEWTVPEGIVRRNVCYPSGLLPTANCQSQVEEVFISGTEPTTFDNIWQVFKINRETGRLATVYTPPELIEDRVYQILPPEADDWVRQANIPQPPREYDPLPAEVQTGEAQLTNPPPFAYLRGQIDIRGIVRGEQFQFFRLQYGEGLNPTAWTQIGGDRGELIEEESVLQTWDTTGLSGLYTLQLVVVREEQRFDLVSVQVTIDNQPPSAGLLTPQAGETFSLNDESIIIQPQVTDNLSLAQVEIIVDGRVIDTRTVAPYTTRWRMTVPGEHTIRVRAVDAAGNVTNSPPITIIVTPTTTP